MAILNRVVGHQKSIEQLLSASASNRLAPTLLFVGPEGVGKQLVALGLAQTLVCETQSGCGTCGPCLRVEKKSSESVLFLNPDGAQIKMEQARQVTEFISLRRLGPARVVILNEAEKLNPQAANSLLKTFEEPPEQTFFILIAPSQASILGTIRSRAQIVRFGALSEKELEKIMAAPNWAYRSCQGQPLRLQELATPESDKRRKAAFHFFEMTKSAPFSWALSQIKELADDRESALQLTRFWQQFIRDLLVLSAQCGSLLHADFEYQKFLPLRQEPLNILSKHCLLSERDLLTNVDRQLVLGNLWNQTRRALTA